MSRRTSAALAVMGLFAAKGCFVVLDYSEYQPVGQGGAGGSSGPGGGQAGAGGTLVCVEGEACYTGAPGTENVGVCLPGTWRCNGEGSADDECFGQVTPTPDIVLNLADEDCDGTDCATPVFSHSHGDAADQALLAIAVNTDEDAYVAGWFKGTLDIGAESATRSQSGAPDLWVAKLASGSGDAEWIYHDNQTTLTRQVRGLATSELVQGVIAVGSEYDVPEVSDPTMERGFVQIIHDSTSSPASERTIAASGGAHADGVAASTGLIYAAGMFRGAFQAVDFAMGTALVPDTVPPDRSDILLIQYGPALMPSWARSYGGDLDDEALAIAVDRQDGGAVITGRYRGSPANMMGIPAAGTQSDTFVMKVDADGALLWARGFVDADDGGGVPERNAAGHAVAVDASGNILVTGALHGSTDFRPNMTMRLTSQGDADAFVAKLDTYGTVLWAMRFGDAAKQIGTGISTDMYGNVYVTGTFAGAIELDDDPATQGDVLAAGGNQDLFFLKLSPEGAVLCGGRFASQTLDPSGIARIATGAGGRTFLAGTWPDPGRLDFDGTTLEFAGKGLDVFVARFDAPLPN